MKLEFYNVSVHFAADLVNQTLQCKSDANLLQNGLLFSCRIVLKDKLKATLN